MENAAHAQLAARTVFSADFAACTQVHADELWIIPGHNFHACPSDLESSNAAAEEAWSLAGLRDQQVAHTKI